MKIFVYNTNELCSSAQQHAFCLRLDIVAFYLIFQVNDTCSLFCCRQIKIYTVHLCTLHENWAYALYKYMCTIFSLDGIVGSLKYEHVRVLKIAWEYN